MHHIFSQSDFLTRSYQRIHILDDLCKVLIQMSHKMLVNLYNTWE